MKLGRREAEVLAMLSKGQELKEVASALNVAVSTASVHLHRAKAKLKARTSFQAMYLFAREKVKEEI